MKNGLIIQVFFFWAWLYSITGLPNSTPHPPCVYVFDVCVHVCICLLGRWYPMAFIHKLLMLFFPLSTSQLYSFLLSWNFFTNTEVRRANEWSHNCTNILTFLGRNDSSEAYYLVCMMRGMCYLEAHGGWLQMSHSASLVLHKQSALLIPWHTIGGNNDSPCWFSEGEKKTYLTLFSLKNLRRTLRQKFHISHKIWNYVMICTTPYIF